jgi:hypothetical protein
MSNFLAIATVTATLGQVLQPPVSAGVPGATVTTLRPDGAGAGPRPAGVNIYLYQVTSNAAYRNADLPTRTSDGDVVQRPQAALDLHYLFTFQGDETTLEPQRLLGIVASTLQAKPVLSRQDISSTAAGTGFLARSDLADQVELVKFTPSPLSLEELSKVWSVFFQTPYNLSVAYQATVVLIESDDTPRRALPVRARTVTVRPFRFPRIDRVTSQAGADAAIVAGSTLLIEGAQLRGDQTLVLLGGTERTPLAVSDSEITLALPPDIPAGIQGLQVLQRVSMGIPPQPHRGFESNVAAFVLRPTITAENATSTLVTLKVDPNIHTGQRAVMLLNRQSAGPPAAYSFTSPPAPAETDTLEFQISGVPAGAYFVRVQVDGAESPLDLDPASLSFGPRVTIP